MSKKNGFTLTELLIVIVIIGVLASIILPRLRGHVEKARVAEAVMFLGQMRRGELRLYDRTGSYLGIPIQPGGSCSSSSQWTNCWYNNAGIAPPDYTQPNSFWRYAAFTTNFPGCGPSQRSGAVGYVQAIRYTGPAPGGVPRTTYPQGSIILCYDGTWRSAGAGGGDYAQGTFLAPNK